VAGDAQRGHHLLAGGFAMAADFLRVPDGRATDDGSQNRSRGKPLPEDDLTAGTSLAAEPGFFKHLAHEARRRRTALECLAQLAFEFAVLIDLGIKFHG
jgi:hypothetical protein